MSEGPIYLAPLARNSDLPTLLRGCLLKACAIVDSGVPLGEARWLLEFIADTSQTLWVMEHDRSHEPEKH